MLAILIACPLLSAVSLAGIAVGVGAVFGARSDLGIGAAVAAVVFVVNTVALCLAFARGENDRVAVATPASEPAADAAAFARAS